jgi:hypothetical protein
MPNTFPSSGNVGIGTSTPENLLTIDSGSSLGVARIKGRSPAWVFGSAGTSSGGETMIGLVTVAGDYVPGSLAGDSFLLRANNSGKIYLGRTANQFPIVTIDNAANKVGLGTSSPFGQFVVADPARQTLVQLQGGAAGVGTKTMALGYGGSFDSVAMDEAAFVQVEEQGSYYRPLELQPLGGLVWIGRKGPPLGSYIRPDRDLNQYEVDKRFVVTQRINDVANFPLGDGSPNKFHTMAHFAMNSTMPQSANNNDIGCGFFIISQDGGGAWVRALEAHAVRKQAAAQNRTWGLEVGVHVETIGTADNDNVGIYLHCSDLFVSPGLAQKANTGILIEGNKGWYKPILYRNTSGTPQFYVTDTGTVFAVGFANISTAEMKENIAALVEQEAMELMNGLNPVKYNLKDEPDQQRMGFIAEDVPAPISTDGRSYSLPAVVATLAGAVKAQQRLIQELKSRLVVLERQRTKGA